MSLLASTLRLVIISSISTLCIKAQVANIIANGSFEEHYPCAPFYPTTLAKQWLAIDSIGYCGNYRSKCDMSVPLNGNGYQYAKSGDAYVIITLFFVNQGRGYLKNRLKQNLIAGKTYCVKFYVNITNTSPRGMNGFGVFFGDSSIDTITKCKIPLTYLSPQIKNPLGNVISDTMNWVPITGTFVANGTEKYAIVGNFLADTAVTTSPIYTQSYPQTWTDVNIDDVSCIELNLPAYAGPDKSCIPGDSVFIGRQPDFAIDPGCIWYRLPNLTPIDTISGLWVKPLVTTTYVVRQELDCSPLKWDTVVVFANPLGLKGLEGWEGLKVYPVPTAEVLNVKLEMLDVRLGMLNGAMSTQKIEITIINNLGQIVREEELTFKNNISTIRTEKLENGIYELLIKSGNSQTVSKRFVISRN
jgi:hypothetical protein